MRKIISLILMCAIPLMSMTGCFDAQEVTEWAYVYSIGMEKGVTDKLRMTVQVQTMKGAQDGSSQSGGSGGGQEKGDTEIITVDCPTFYSGVNMINTYVSRQINYMHTKFLVFSENLAREGIDSYITAFTRGRQIRRQMNVIVTKGSASEFLKENTTAVSSSVSKKLQNIIDQGNRTGFFRDATYDDLLDDTKSYYGQGTAMLAAVNDDSRFIEGEGTGELPFKTSGDYYAGDLVRKGGSKTEILGTAVFDGGKMVGELNGDETRALLMVRGEFNRGNFAVRDPQKPELSITTDIRRQKSPSVKVSFEGDKPVVDVKVFLEGDILAIQSTVDYETKELKPMLENAYKEEIKDHIDRTIEKCQSLNCDVFKFGAVAAMHFMTIQEWEKYNWLKRFKDVKINTQVEFVIRRTGTLIKSSELLSTEGEKGE